MNISQLYYGPFTYHSQSKFLYMVASKITICGI